MLAVYGNFVILKQQHNHTLLHVLLVYIADIFRVTNNMLTGFSGTLKEHIENTKSIIISVGTL